MIFLGKGKDISEGRVKNSQEGKSKTLKTTSYRNALWGNESGPYRGGCGPSRTIGLLVLPFWFGMLVIYSVPDSPLWVWCENTRKEPQLGSKPQVSSRTDLDERTLTSDPFLLLGWKLDRVWDGNSCIVYI